MIKEKEPKQLSSNGIEHFWFGVWLFIITAFVLYSGEPDIHSAIIIYLTGQ